jgi:adenosylcobyric acid synthase
MVCGTGSDAGKSRIVTGLCRSLARRGVSVAPFKAQNMALNSFVTAEGAEIGRAQGTQALAAGIEPHVDMNPILLKPTGERTSQVIVGGVPTGVLDAAAYHAAKPDLRPVVLAALERLRASFDVVVLEGAGSPAEINLLDGDLVNLWLAGAAGVPAVLVGDIDRGGVSASLYGTVALLPGDLAGHIRAFVINKFRGDPGLLTPGLAELETRTGIPTVGVVPWQDGIDLDAEDSLALPRPNTAAPGGLDVAVVRFPRISNFTDLDPLAREPGVGVRYVDRPDALGDPDLVVLPGTKATVADLEWLRDTGFVPALARCACLLGICGGYQMLGRTISDPDGVESERRRVTGLGLLDVDTTFAAGKVVRRRRGTAEGEPVAGYQIHHGRVDGAEPWIVLDDGSGDGAVDAAGRVYGTTLHGLFESDGFRDRFLAGVARRRGRPFTPSGRSFAAAREAQFDAVADLLEAHLDMAAIDQLIERSEVPRGTAGAP